MDFEYDPFIDASGQARVLLGVSAQSGATRIAELAGRIGFDAVWIDTEHGPSSYNEVEALCVATEAGGALPTVRVACGNREHVLRALEAGARIVVTPMINTADEARAVVEYGKYAPLGKRGYYTRSRGVQFGLAGLDSFEQANARTHLFCQMETLEAVQNLDAICEVEGIAGVLIGPGDLSANLGRPGKFDDPELLNLVENSIRRIKSHGKRAAILTAPGPLLDLALAAGVDLAFVGGDVQDLVVAWKERLLQIRAKVT